MNYSSTLLTSKKSHTRVLLGIIALMVSSLGVAAAAREGQPNLEAKEAIASLQQTGKAFAGVAKDVSPSVVFVSVEKKHESGMDAATLKKFFGDRVPKENLPQYAQGVGSGFILSEDGFIVTNNHVISDAEKINIRMSDGREFDAKLVGSDQQTDVAIIKVDAQDLPALPMGNSDAIEIGEWVLAFGSPFGLPGTVTSGIVSAKGRNHVGITDYENFIQTDAAINPGNSGGPLVNLEGEVVGINTAIVSRSGGYMGIGFAIPINQAQTIYQQLIENGQVTRGYLGIMIQPLTSDLAKAFGIDSGKGILVADFPEGSPAQQAGIQQGDVIIEMDGQPVIDAGRFRNGVAQLPPGSHTTLVVQREGEQHQITVNLGTMPTAAAAPPVSTDDLLTRTLGIEVRPLADELAAKENDEMGVIVSKVLPGSRAALAGLRPGMIIQQVNRNPITNIDELHQQIKLGKETGSLLMLVHRADYSQYIVIETED